MPTVAGWIETATLPDQGLTLDAKLDTGAVSASLNVTDLERFKRKGKTWYRFTIHGTDGKTATVEQQTSRISRVKRAEVKDTLRPIVRLKVCVAGHEAVTDFNLTDRSGQGTPLLIGRKFLLATHLLVDSSRTHLFAKPCEAGK
ncbi:MAG: RimK/LysX family protein [Pseudolabrys sp.]